MSKTFLHNNIAQHEGFDIYKTSSGFSWDRGGPFHLLREVKADIDVHVANGTGHAPFRRERISRRRFDDVSASW